MSVDALPYTLLIIFAEFTIGGLWVLWLADLRGGATPSFIKFGAGLVFVTAALTFWIAAKLSVTADVDGYPLDTSFMPPTRIAFAFVFALTLPYAILSLTGARRLGLVAGGVASATGLIAIALLSQVFALPTWGYIGTMLSLTVGALALGAVSMGMILGHWYLVTPRLPERPLREMTFFLLLTLGFQALLIIPSLALPRDEVANSLDTPIALNPFFWMRVGGGLAFPIVLTYMAFDSSSVRAMQSATGLLYIAMALVLSGEVLAKGLLFATAVPT
ncbi:MAG: hypothetical protein V3S20_03860 [Dehalococcoidia bacterium]